MNSIMMWIDSNIVLLLLGLFGIVIIIVILASILEHEIESRRKTREFEQENVGYREEPIK